MIFNSDIDNIIFKNNYIFDIYDVKFNNPPNNLTCFNVEFTNLKKIKLFEYSFRIMFCPLLETIIYNNKEYDLREDIFLDFYNNVLVNPKPLLYCNNSKYDYNKNLEIAKYSYPQDIKNCFIDEKLTSHNFINDNDYLYISVVIYTNKNKLIIETENANDQIVKIENISTEYLYKDFALLMTLNSYYFNYNTNYIKYIITDFNNKMDYFNDYFIKEIGEDPNKYSGIYNYMFGVPYRIHCVWFLKNCYNFFSTNNSTGIYFLKGIDYVVSMLHKFKICVDTEETKKLLQQQNFNNIEIILSDDPNLNPYKPQNDVIDKNIFYINFILNL